MGRDLFYRDKRMRIRIPDNKNSERALAHTHTDTQALASIHALSTDDLVCRAHDSFAYKRERACQKKETTKTDHIGNHK